MTQWNDVSVWVCVWVSVPVVRVLAVKTPVAGSSTGRF